MKSTLITAIILALLLTQVSYSQSDLPIFINDQVDFNKIEKEITSIEQKNIFNEITVDKFKGDFSNEEGNLKHELLNKNLNFALAIDKKNEEFEIKRICFSPNCIEEKETIKNQDDIKLSHLLNYSEGNKTPVIASETKSNSTLYIVGGAILGTLALGFVGYKIYSNPKTNVSLKYN